MSIALSAKRFITICIAVCIYSFACAFSLEEFDLYELNFATKESIKKSKKKFPIKDLSIEMFGMRSIVLLKEPYPYYPPTPSSYSTLGGYISRYT